ncbi:aspartate kinase [Staphylococcus condimenti]|uniref:Aspartokinase n=1 Tax=Staphylococcus condimenti TaxID=70255 RepID=A0A143P8T2_9STAP|nr:MULTISPECIES: aspartate kinase [Staphylococcus]AMY04877.1 aspartate kinase [Staphylococcus condimenti]APR61121.1 aspartate kinase [Staphylococcus condimenti]MDK8644151.1 aspartate kinase [Staphylococcus condimenti]OFP01103.1 aspartate kinase [Staphylococcus sp. HMSC065E08]PNZ60055.1 aspartate kinase [Staphylococcus condimenti]
MKVAKFGGSSVASASQIQKVLNIANSDDDRKIIVVSAPGKRHPEDIKTTDLLLRLYEKSVAGLDYQNKKDEIINRYADIVHDLNMDTAILDEFSTILEERIEKYREHSPRLKDALLSCGEDFNARLIAQYNNSQGVPTTYISPLDAGITVTDTPQFAQILEESYDNIYKLRDIKGKIIVPGFFGYSKKGNIVTFPRGGSDITGAILARGVRAELYENYSDVSGIYRANPNLIKDAEIMGEVTYREMRELSYAGFSVFHDEALQPVQKERIPVVIKNTNRPQDPGTYIRYDREIKPDHLISGLSCDKGFTVINISKYLMNRQVGFTRKVLTVLEDNDISFDHMPSGIDGISIIMRSHQIEGKENKVLNEIRKQCDVDELSIESDLAILMVVGLGMSQMVGTANKITEALAKANINLKMINQGASEISMMFGISVKDADNAVRATYEGCCCSADKIKAPAE